MARRWTKKQAASLAARLKETSNALPAQPKRRKYRNEEVVYEGQKFDSKREFARYAELLTLQRAGLIANLRRQVQFELIPKNRRADGTLERACHYIADLVYEQGGERVVEDVKSEATRKLSTFVLKRKLLLHVHGITLREVL